MEHCVHARVIELSNNRIIISLHPCALHCVQTRIYIYISMGVTGASNDWTVFVDLFFTWFIYIYIFVLILDTHTGTAIITTTAILSSIFFFFWNESIYYYRLYVKKTNCWLPPKFQLRIYISPTYHHVYSTDDSILLFQYIYILEKTTNSTLNNCLVWFWTWLKI